MLARLFLLCFLPVSLALDAQNTSKFLLRKSGDGFNLYHIKPQPFVSSAKGKTAVDFTFVVHDTSHNLITLNFSFKSSDLKGLPERMTIVWGANSLEVDSMKLLYLDRTGNSWNSRISAHFAYSGAKNALQNPFTLVLYYPTEKAVLSPRKRALHRIRLAVEIITLENPE